MNQKQKIKIYTQFLPVFFVVSGILIPFIPFVYRADIIRGAVISIFIFFSFFNQSRYDKISKYIFALMVLLLMSMFYSYNQYNVFNVDVIKVLISYSFYFIGYNYIKSKESYYKFNLLFLYILIIYFSVILILNIFNLNTFNYARMDISLGSQGVNSIKSLVPLAFIISNLFFFNLSRVKYWIIVLSYVGITALLMIGQKRGDILTQVTA